MSTKNKQERERENDGEEDEEMRKREMGLVVWRREEEEDGKGLLPFGEKEKRGEREKGFELSRVLCPFI